MIKGIKLLTLTDDNISEILKLTDSHLYNFDQTLIYKNNVPNAAYCLIDGILRIKKYDNSIFHLDKFQLVAYEECLQHRPFKHELQVVKNTTILVLPKSLLKNTHIISIVLNSEMI